MNIEFIDVSKKNNKFLLENPLLYGDNLTKIREFIVNDTSIDVYNGIFSNASKVSTYFIDPSKTNNSDKMHLSKVLAIGKVQSGKTSFFITSIALAFDNGYDISLVIGGTKNTLKDQNYQRITEYFENNSNVKVFDINKVSYEDIENKLSLGYKIVLVSLKNSSGSKNLGRIISNLNLFKKHSILVIDDEGDEVTPGAPKNIEKIGRNGINHDAIASIIHSLICCTYVSVTATPQANFLISTFDAISPDYCVLVQPGISYTGGTCFHDSDDNSHVVEIYDTDNFKKSIPQTFIDSLYFFLFSCCLKRHLKILEPFSMLVHPSSLTKIQSSIVEKIKDKVHTLKNILQDKYNVSYKDTINNIYNQYLSYKEMNQENDITITYDDIDKEINNVVDELDIFEFNISSSGKSDIKREKDSKASYRIYVGGNMLGRGLTIKNLSTTYIYRDSNSQAIDTLYQRARWLGYKAKYFDICRVYMTNSLKQQFITVVDSENEMWQDIESFLNTNINIKKLPRIFALNDNTGKLLLTRKSISNTVTFSVVNKGFQYNRTCNFTREQKYLNYSLYQNYFDAHKSEGFEKCFNPDSPNKFQTHFIIKTTFKEFYYEFLSKYIYPRGSKFNNLTFSKILQNIENNLQNDELYVIVMRYKTGQFRSLKGEIGNEIKELINSYNNSETYSGDKDLEGYKSLLHFQIHLVYTNENEPDKKFPMLAFNNPLSEKTIKYVTGDNVYEG